jgi:RNA polymerase sigma factor (TIGR02999 family)
MLGTQSGEKKHGNCLSSRASRQKSAAENGMFPDNLCCKLGARAYSERVSMLSNEDLTGFLRAWCAGDRANEAALFKFVYPVLRGMAHKQMQGQRGGVTLQATEIAHEAYFRIFEQGERDWKTRSQFFALAATVMRRVFIDHLRERNAQKRGGELHRVSLTSIDEAEMPASTGDEWLKLDQVLSELEQFDPSSSRVVEMRYFLGMTVQEIALALGCSSSNIERQWRGARAWLHRRIELDK